MDRCSSGSRPAGELPRHHRLTAWRVLSLATLMLLADSVSPATALPEAAQVPSPSLPAAVRNVAVYPAARSVIGTASWYGGRHNGRPTACGETHAPNLRTAAHRSLPFGTLLRVTNLKNGKTSLVRVNDRGPYVAGRAIDLSERAARDLAMLDDGLAHVRLEILHGRSR